MTVQFETITLHADGVDLPSRQAGSGKPVLYLHPAGGFTPSRPLGDLASERRVIAPLAPGFDDTPPLAGIDSVPAYAALLGRLLDAHVGERIDVIGSSFGSRVALWLAVSRPDLVDHLILGVPGGFRFDGKGGLPADPQERFRALYAHPDKIVGPQKSAQIMEANARAYRHIGQDVALDEELDARLGAVEAVTLIIQGTEDSIVPAEAGAHLKRSIRQSQRVFVYDAAHAIESDQPERVSGLWRGFLEWGPGFVLNRATEQA